MPHRALITGVSGFAGGFLAEHLLAVGDSVLGLTPDGRWTASSPLSIQGRVELAAWDLGRESLPDPVRLAIERFAPQVIYHLAAISTPRDCGEGQPTEFAMAVNVGGTRRVLELAMELPSRPRVLLVSSSHVYARVERGSCRVDEETPLAPRTAYGQTKLAAEEEVRRAIAQGCDALIVRAFQHTGPRQEAPMILVQWAQQFAQGGSSPVRVHTCDAHVDLSDVRDVVRAYRLLMEHGRPGAVYNVGTGVSRRSGDLFRQMRRMAGCDRAAAELYPGVKQEPIADITRLVHATGWAAAIPIEQTIADMLDWWRGRLTIDG
jgi:GDP-4-dehydro-6-deoxy-D-mannose reductase